jgi:prevent-host-death family protein
MKPEIGSYDAKTKLPELLREVQAGQRFTITLRGKPVAELVPARATGAGGAARAIAAMQEFQKIKGVADSDVLNWIAEGRR